MMIIYIYTNCAISHPLFYIYIHNCRKYCFGLLGLVSAVPMYIFIETGFSPLPLYSNKTLIYSVDKEPNLPISPYSFCTARAEICAISSIFHTWLYVETHVGRKRNNWLQKWAVNNWKYKQLLVTLIQKGQFLKTWSSSYFFCNGQACVWTIAAFFIFSFFHLVFLNFRSIALIKVQLPSFFSHLY